VYFVAAIKKFCCLFCVLLVSNWSYSEKSRFSWDGHVTGRVDWCWRGVLSFFEFLDNPAQSCARRFEEPPNSNSTLSTTA